MLQKPALVALVLIAVFVLTFSACAQSSASETAKSPQALSEAELEAAKQRIKDYMSALYPNLQDISVLEVTPEPDKPFLKGTVEFKNRGQVQKSQVFVTPDSRYLILGQLWDMDVDPARARWEQRKVGAEERLAKVDLTDRPYKGDPNASVVILEFSDYQCPFCSRAYATLEEQVVEKYGDRVKLVFKHLPLESLHPWAKKAAVATTCGYVQSPEFFWKLHSSIFTNQKEITVENLREKVDGFASEIEGLDKERLLSCFDGEETISVVQADLAEAQQLGLRSTPSFLVNGALVGGAISFEEMSTYLDLALEDAGQ